ncbi:SDR family oxidoreductase [Haloferula sargassicola]|uniref:dTDP-4-dehydrorhamnose reductase n=1 Tax=Haloferula sargassicola TaxID=490096 RepID=A0ABP9USL8_9BACT
MRIAVTGVTGRVGRALADHLGRSYEILELPRSRWDLTDPDLAENTAALDFDLLLHPAAMTSVDACERDPAIAEAVHIEGTRRLLEGCGGRPMLYFSTDYVLDGAEEGLKPEDAAVSPAGVYGTTKAAAERLVLEAGSTVMRVSWVFGPEKPSFIDMIARQAVSGGELEAIDDKFSLPCFTTDLALWVKCWISAGGPAGLFHACNSGPPVSWHGMAEVVVRILAEDGRLASLPSVRRLRLEEMEAFVAPRPRHTAMATDRLSALLGKEPRPWPEALGLYLRGTAGLCR